MVELLQHVQVVNQPVDFTLELTAQLPDQPEETFLECLHSDFDHLGVGKVDNHAGKAENKVSDALNDNFGADRFLVFFEIGGGLHCEWFHMKIKEFLKPGPEFHADIIKVMIEGFELFLLEGVFVFLVDGEDEENSKDIVGCGDSGLEVFDEDVVAGTEDGPEEVDGAFGLDVEELGGEDDLIHDAIHEGLVDGLEDLFDGELLTFLVGDVVENDVCGPEVR